MGLKPLGVQLSLIFCRQDVLLMIDLRVWGQGQGVRVGAEGRAVWPV